jgi:hypothetical protein
VGDGEFMNTGTPARSAAVRTSSAATDDVSKGFVVITGLPASTARRTSSAFPAGPTISTTASTVGSARTSSSAG